MQDRPSADAADDEDAVDDVSMRFAAAVTRIVRVSDMGPRIGRWAACNRGIVTDDLVRRLSLAAVAVTNSASAAAPPVTAGPLLLELCAMKLRFDEHFVLLASLITTGRIGAKSRLRAAVRYLHHEHGHHLSSTGAVSVPDEETLLQQCGPVELDDSAVMAIVAATFVGNHEDEAVARVLRPDQLLWLLKQRHPELHRADATAVLRALSAVQEKLGGDPSPQSSLSVEAAKARLQQLAGRSRLNDVPPAASVEAPVDVSPTKTVHHHPAHSASHTPGGRRLFVDQLVDGAVKLCGKDVCVVGTLGRIKEPFRVTAELWGTKSSCTLHFPKAVTKKDASRMQGHVIMVFGKLFASPDAEDCPDCVKVTTNRPTVAVSRFVAKEDATPVYLSRRPPTQSSSVPRNVWTWERFDHSPLAPPPFLRKGGPAAPPNLNRRAILIVNTGGTFSCVQDPVTGKLSPRPLYSYLAQMPTFANGGLVLEHDRASHPTASYVLLEDGVRLMLDSTCMSAANSWNLLCMILESRTAPSAGYRAVVVIHGTDTLAYSASALTFGLRGLRVPVVLTGSMMPLRPVEEQASPPASEEDGDDSEAEVSLSDSEDGGAGSDAIPPPPLSLNRPLSAGPAMTAPTPRATGDVLEIAQSAASYSHFATPRARSAAAPPVFMRAADPTPVGSARTTSTKTRSTDGPAVTDALENLTRALVYAASPRAVNEVVVFFNNKVMLGTRVVKAHAVQFDAFQSPNFSILGFFDGQLHISRHVSELIARSSAVEREKVDASETTVVGALRPPCVYHWNARVVLAETTPSTLPDDAASIIRALIAASGGFDLSMEVPLGLVFRGYGTGNAQPEVSTLLRYARKELCIPVIWCSQCFAGSTHGSYSVGLSRVHGVNVGDMTRECAYVRMLHAMSQFAGVLGPKFKRSKRFVRMIEECMSMPYRLCFSPTEGGDDVELADYIRDSTISRYQ